MNLEKLRALWDGHARAVYAYALRLTKNEADASDFLQELFCRLGRKPALVERLSAGEARGYLLRLAHNVVVDHVRRAQAKDRIFEKITAARAGEFALDAGPDEALLRRELLAALDELPADQRVVVHGRLWKMRTLDEIARELGISINTAASRYRYGIDKMRTRLRSLYEDFAPRASSKPKQPMKNTNPFSHPAEEPIIRPLEQRRVPSATGAAFALPVVPEAPEDLPVDEVPDTIETEVDPEVGDPIFTIDPLPAEEAIEGELPVTFEEVVKVIDDGEVVDGPVGEGEEFNPDWIFYTLFSEEMPAGEGEVIEGEIAIDDIIEEAPVDKDGDGVPDEEVTGEIIEEVPLANDADGDGLDDKTGEPIFYTLDMVKRGGGVTTVDEVAGEEANPEIYYSMAGGSPISATGGPAEVPESPADADPAPVHAHEAPADHAAPPVVHTATHSPTEAAFQLPTTSPAPVLPAASTPAIIHLDDVHVPATPVLDTVAAGFDHSGLASPVVPVVFGNASADVPAASFDTTGVDSTVDEWVPIHADIAGHSETLESFTADALPIADAIAPIDAGAAPAAGHPSLPGGSLAMAATGAVVLSREAKTRDEEERA